MLISSWEAEEFVILVNDQEFIVKQHLTFKCPALWNTVLFPFVIQNKEAKSYFKIWHPEGEVNII